MHKNLLKVLLLGTVLVLVLVGPDVSIARLTYDAEIKSGDESTHVSGTVSPASTTALGSSITVGGAGAGAGAGGDATPRVGERHTIILEDRTEGTFEWNGREYKPVTDVSTSPVSNSSTTGSSTPASSASTTTSGSPASGSTGAGSIGTDGGAGAGSAAPAASDVNAGTWSGGSLSGKGIYGTRGINTDPPPVHVQLGSSSARSQDDAVYAYRDAGDLRIDSNGNVYGGGRIYGHLSVGDNKFDGVSLKIESQAVLNAATQYHLNPSVGNAAQVAANNAAQSVVNSHVANALRSEINKATAQLQAAGKEVNGTTVAAQVKANMKGNTRKVVDAANGAKSDATTASQKSAKDSLEEAGVSDEVSEKVSEEMGTNAADKAVQDATDNPDKAIDNAVKQDFDLPKAGSLQLPVNIFNVPQYALAIMEALEGRKQDDATKEVKVKGAEPMGDSQGSPSSGASTTASLPNTPMSATTISGAATSLISLLDMGKIDISLLSDDIEKPKQPETKEAVPVISAAAGTSGGQSTGSALVATTPTEESSTQSEEEKLTTRARQEIIRRRALLLAEWANAAAQIGEGSNAISSTFYDRAAAFAAAANSAQGSLGGISTITDTDRFVLFEITRGTALSAVQLGLQGAINLNAIDEVIKTTPDDSGSAAPSITIRPGTSQ